MIWFERFYLFLIAVAVVFASGHPAHFILTYVRYKPLTTWAGFSPEFPAAHSASVFSLACSRRTRKNSCRRTCLSCPVSAPTQTGASVSMSSPGSRLIGVRLPVALWKHRRMSLWPKLKVRKPQLPGKGSRTSDLRLEVWKGSTFNFRVEQKDTLLLFLCFHSVALHGWSQERSWPPCCLLCTQPPRCLGRRAWKEMLVRPGRNQENLHPLTPHVPEVARLAGNI